MIYYNPDTRINTLNNLRHVSGILEYLHELDNIKYIILTCHMWKKVRSVHLKQGTMFGLICMPDLTTVWHRSLELLF